LARLLPSLNVLKVEDRAITVMEADTEQVPLPAIGQS